MQPIDLGKLVGRSDAMERAVDIPLFVVTAGSDGEISGCLAGFVTQSSINPLRYLACISQKNHTHRVVAGATGLAIHLLGAEQRDMASLFGEETADVVDKFRSVSWAKGTTGAPVLEKCAAWVEGSIINRLDAGDHEAFLVEVTDGGIGACHGQLMQSDVSDFTAGHPA